MEYEEQGLIQAVRYQLGLIPMPEKPQKPFQSTWVTSALGDSAVDMFKKARDSFLERELLEGVQPSEFEKKIQFFVEKWNANQEQDARKIIEAMGESLRLLRKAQEQAVFYGTRIVETPHLSKEVQCRRHRKKRINKKWRKRYGMKRVPDPNMILIYNDPVGGRTVYVHPKMAEKVRAEMVEQPVDDRLKQLYGIIERSYL